MPDIRSQRDAPGTQREYETVYILRPESTTEQIHDINVRVRRIIEAGGGKVVRVDNWGKRKLAYEIEKQLKGIYLYWLYLGESMLVAEIERNLRMLDLVIRHFSVKVDESINPEARPTQMDEEKFAATATTVPDEEDTYLGRGGYDEQFGGGEGGLEDESDEFGDEDRDVVAPGTTFERRPRAAAAAPEGAKTEGAKTEAAEATTADDAGSEEPDKEE